MAICPVRTDQPSRLEALRSYFFFAAFFLAGFFAAFFLAAIQTHLPSVRLGVGLEEESKEIPGQSRFESRSIVGHLRFSDQ
jgi:hypothetical protein